MLLAGAMLWPSAAQAALSLTTTASPSFSASLTGADQTSTYQLLMSVSDTTGLGLGWHLSVTSTPFATGASPSYAFPNTASTITAVNATCAVAPCTNPVNTVMLPVSVPAGITPPPAAPFFDAQAATGTGQFTVTATINVNVPANSYSGTYTSTLTLGIASGP